VDRHAITTADSATLISQRKPDHLKKRVQLMQIPAKMATYISASPTLSSAVGPAGRWSLTPEPNPRFRCSREYCRHRSMTLLKPGSDSPPWYAGRACHVVVASMRGVGVNSSMPSDACMLSSVRELKETIFKADGQTLLADS
jgi:hypothetical protein